GGPCRAGGRASGRARTGPAGPRSSAVHQAGPAPRGAGMAGPGLPARAARGGRPLPGLGRHLRRFPGRRPRVERRPGRPLFERLSEAARERRKPFPLGVGGDRAPAIEALGKRVNGEFGVDPFGFDPDYALSAIAPFAWLYKNYFRVETHGIERVPSGRVFLVGNHAG